MTHPDASDADSHTVLVRDFVRYMMGRGYARNTRRDRASCVRRWLRSVPDWRSATWRDVEHYACGLGLIPASRRVHLAHVRAFYRWAMREGLAEADPTHLVDNPRCPTYLPRPARDEDIAFVMARETPSVRAMIGVMATAGLRCCEVSAANWEDVDLQAGTMLVHGKGARQRFAFLTDDAMRLLRSLESGPTGPIWPGVFRPRLSAARVSQIVNGAFRSAGLATEAHQLRHRTGTIGLGIAGGDLTIVRDLLGHSSVATTEGYAAVAGGAVARVGRAIPFPLAAAV